jgi:hypothetical protein
MGKIKKWSFFSEMVLHFWPIWKTKIEVCKIDKLYTKNQLFFCAAKLKIFFYSIGPTEKIIIFLNLAAQENNNF